MYFLFLLRLELVLGGKGHSHRTLIAKDTTRGEGQPATFTDKVTAGLPESHWMIV